MKIINQIVPCRSESEIEKLENSAKFSDMQSNQTFLSPDIRAFRMPFIFILLIIIGWYYSGFSFTFLTNEVLIRFIRNGIMVLALLIPILAGMGLNFAITIGAIAAQIGWIFIIDFQIHGLPGIFATAIIGSIFSILFGWMIGKILNKTKGKEMIATMIIGFIGTSIYQFIFLIGFGNFIPVHNKEIILSRGVGVRNMVDLHNYRNIIDKYWLIKIGSIEIPLFMIIVIIAFSIIVFYIMNSKIGHHFKAIGESAEKSELLGLDVDTVRIKALIISTVLACLGQIVFLQNIGMLNVYTAHLNSDIFSIASLLAGGATVRNAKVRHAIIGIFLFHSLFIVSPQAGQNIFNNPAIGEYFRTFIAYGTIAFALISSRSPKGIKN